MCCLVVLLVGGSTFTGSILCYAGVCVVEDCFRFPGLFSSSDLAAVHFINPSGFFSQLFSKNLFNWNESVLRPLPDYSLWFAIWRGILWALSGCVPNLRNPVPHFHVMQYCTKAARIFVNDCMFPQYSRIILWRMLYRIWFQRIHATRTPICKQDSLAELQQLLTAPIALHFSHPPGAHFCCRLAGHSQICKFQLRLAQGDVAFPPLALARLSCRTQSQTKMPRNNIQRRRHSTCSIVRPINPSIRQTIKQSSGQTLAPSNHPTTQQ